MKTDLDLMEMATELDRQRKSKRDFIVDTPAMRFAAGTDGAVALEVPQIDLGRIPLRPTAHQQFANATGVNGTRVIIIATSNDASRLEKALRHRFRTYCFGGGPPFASACYDRLPKIWGGEAGDIPMPSDWQRWGWDGESFSMRLALDMLEEHLRLVQEEVLV